MNSKKNILAVIVLISIHTNAKSQLNGFINRTKNKIENKVIQDAAGQPKTEANNPATANNQVIGKDTKLQSVKETKQPAAATEWQVAKSDGYSGGGGKYSYDMLTRYYNPLKTYTHIRKVGEQGALHFAKDYPELKEITEPENKNISISFSTEPYKGGAGKPATQFNSSSNHIYARLVVNGSTLKEALKLNGTVFKLNVDFHIYPSGSEDFIVWDAQSVIYPRPRQLSTSILDFDIRPSPDNITVYNDPEDKYMFYFSSFPSLHTSQYFPKSGNYKIGIKVSVPVADEWGNSTGKTIETMGFFDYAFEVKDAKAIYDEGQVVRKAIQSGVRYTPKPMPKEWKMISASSVVAGYTAAKYNQLYNNFYKDVKIIKTYLSPVAAASWKVIMNSDNVMPAYKYCTQTVLFFVKDASGNCYYHPCDLRQNYTGGGTYGDIFLAAFDEEKVYVNCEEMK